VDALALLTSPPTDLAAGLAFTRVGRRPGDAPTVLLVHGIGGARVVWAPVLPALAQRYHVLAVDLPGHGDSAPLGPGDDPRCAATARRLASACAELGVPRPHVVGNSLGGWIGLEMAADGAASSLVALAPAGLRIRPVPPSPLLRANRFLARTTTGLADRLLGNDWLRRIAFASGSADPVAVDADLARAVVTSLARCTAYEVMLATTAHSRFERRRQVRVATTIVFGDRDWILPGPNQRRELAPADARWLRLDRCGHAPMWDAAEDTVRIIEQTIDATVDAATAARDGADGRSALGVQ
jgi:pimeloyl-ACP methyl ester carboxylesterase